MAYITILYIYNYNLIHYIIDNIKALLHETINKMFAKQNYDNDKFLQASLNR